MNGLIVVDKPQGWTSHDVVGKMRRIAGTKKIGHLGTLDPMATGVLPLLLNRATRLAQFFTANDKIYEGVIRFGFSTNTYDANGEPAGPDSGPAIGRDALEAVLERFRGTFLQTPPPVSAKKVDGRKAYELARKNIPVDLKPVEVTVHALDLLHLDGRDAIVRVHCSAGAYVRSIAHDAGQALGCGAHLASLRRIQSGVFTISTARTLDQLQALAGEGHLDHALVPSARLLPEIPLEIVDSITEAQIRNGRDFRVSPFHGRGDARLVKAVTRSGDLVAIGEIVMPNLYHPTLVL
ncbi:MAG TPA: tRNA pseudouridine(55) synthase TruB [Bryobacteraceae bacterium]|nr:tRNA pseudouridine(55) synthase TruB [Bryobacteraceae bacterium]